MADQPDAAWEALADGNKNITLSPEECCPPSTPCMDALQTIYSFYPDFHTHSAFCALVDGDWAAAATYAHKYPEERFIR